MSIKDSITDSVDLEEKSPQSTRLFTKIAIFVSTLALLLFFVCVVCYQIDRAVGLNFFASIFVPEIILSLISLYLAIAERLRQRYMSATLAIIISCLVMVAIFSFLIYEAVKFGQVFIAPFNPPPSIK